MDRKKVRRRVSGIVTKTSFALLIVSCLVGAGIMPIFTFYIAGNGPLLEQASASNFRETIKIDSADLRGWSSTNCFNLGYGIKKYEVGNFDELVINKTFYYDGGLSLGKIEKVYNLGLDGSIELHSETSLVRIILVDSNFKEHLVYEAYPLIAPSNSFPVEGVCEETCVLELTRPRSLKLQVINASVHIDKLKFSTSAVAGGNITKLRRLIKEAQNEAKIEKINTQIEKKGLKWVAGKTSISRLFYEEKKELFGRDRLPNLQGAEYYKGGILRVGSSENTASSLESTSLVDSFDWRNRHGANDPDSPYYDGDTNGSGWITPVKSQGCNHCWVFAPVHATEAIVNLYFNKHLDIDLSEQDVASCSGGNIGCCEGGYIGTALNYIIDNGVVNENCFLYSASCEDCANKCASPANKIKISGKQYPGYDEDDIKRAVIDYGPITCGIHSWWHFMVLVGFDKDPETGETIWIFKNSWGEDWGENGYGYLKVELSDLYGKYALLTPVTSLITYYEISCYDKDGDGYYNWGISKNEPATCPENAPSEKDCDDSNPCLGPFDSDGSCVPISCQVPDAPSNLNANAVSSSQIDLAWQDNSDNENGFKIYRDGNQINTVGANTTSYSDTGLSTNTQYCYRVSTYNSAGESSKSNQACATTAQPGTPAAFRVTRQGDVYADRGFYCGLSGTTNPPGPPCFNTGTGADIAEYINVSEHVGTGDVVELDPERPGYYRKSHGPHSTLVAGVISSTPGITMGQMSGSPATTLPISQAALTNLNLASAMSAEHSPISVNTSPDNPLPLTFEVSLAQLTKYLPALMEAENKPLLALMGIVPVKATTESGPIQPGDLLTTSSVPGYAMRCADPKKCEGAIIGKALEPLQEGTGIIKMLVMR